MTLNHQKPNGAAAPAVASVRTVCFESRLAWPQAQPVDGDSAIRLFAISTPEEHQTCSFLRTRQRQTFRILPESAVMLRPAVLRLSKGGHREDITGPLPQCHWATRRMSKKCWYAGVSGKALPEQAEGPAGYGDSGKSKSGAGQDPCNPQGKDPLPHLVPPSPREDKHLRGLSRVRASTCRTRNSCCDPDR